VALIQFTSMFYNLERMGNQLALRISDLYNCHKMAVEGLVPEHTVAWIDYENSTDGTEIWRVSNDPYKLLYIEDAGMCQIFLCFFFFFFFLRSLTLASVVGFTKSALRSSYSTIEDFYGAIANTTLVIDQR